MKHSEYIKTLNWKIKRWNKINADAKWVPETNRRMLFCERCERQAWVSNVHVHHLHYETLGSERYGDLEILCDECHGRNHGVDREDVLPGDSIPVNVDERRRRKFVARAWSFGFELNAGDVVQIRKISNGTWRKHYVKHHVEVTKNTHEVGGGFLIGEIDGWLVKVHQSRLEYSP